MASKKIIEELRELDAVGAPVLSLYVNLDPEQVPREAQLSQLEILLAEARQRRLVRSAANLDLEEDINRVRSFFTNEFSDQGICGVAIFSSAQADLFRAVKSDKPLPAMVVVDDRPFIAPLESTLGSTG